jgi:hypothetical protein
VLAVKNKAIFAGAQEGISRVALGVENGVEAPLVSFQRPRGMNADSLGPVVVAQKDNPLHVMGMREPISLAIFETSQEIPAA